MNPPDQPPKDVHRVVVACRTGADGVSVLELAGELDLSTCPDVVTAVRSLLAAGPTGLVVDAAAVTFIDSTGIGTLLSVRRDCRAAEVPFNVVASAGVEKVTRLLGVHEALTEGSDDTDRARAD